MRNILKSDITKKATAFFAVSIASAIISQVGMYVVSLLSKPVNAPSAGSTVLVWAAAAMLCIILWITTCFLLDMKSRSGAVSAAVSLFMSCAVMQSLSFPITVRGEFDSLYFRYPSLAAIFAAAFAGLLIIYGKKRMFMFSAAGIMISSAVSAVNIITGFTVNSPVYICAAIIIFLLIILAVYKPVLAALKKAKPRASLENLFAAAALTVGLTISIVLPSTCYCSWDDEAHYRSTVYFSQSLYTSFTEGDVRMIYDPLGGFTLDERAEYLPVIIDKDEHPERVITLGNSQAFFPNKMAYIGSAVGRWAGQILLLNIAGRFAAGKIGNLLMYVLVMYAAIRKTEKGKLMLTVLALVPTMVYMASNYSYDPWLFSLSCLSFSYFFSALRKPNEKLTEKDCIIIIGALFLAILPKMPYAFLLLFLLLMPKEKFASGKQRKVYIISIIILLLAALALTYIMTFGAGDPADTRGRENISATGQIINILSDIPRYIINLSVFITDYIAPYRTSEYFTRLGYVGGTGGGVIILWLIIMAAFIGSASGDNSLLHKKIGIRLLGAMIILGVTAVIATVMYLVFTPVGSDKIEGCQPRYMFPMLFPYYSIAFSDWFALRLPDNKRAVAERLVFAASAGAIIICSFIVVIQPCLG